MKAHVQGTRNQLKNYLEKQVIWG